MYLFSSCFINHIAESPDNELPSVISGYPGQKLGYFIERAVLAILVIWMFVYLRRLLTTAPLICILFGVTEGLRDGPFYGLVLICIWWRFPRAVKNYCSKISTGMVRQATGSSGAGASPWWVCICITLALPPIWPC